MQCSPRASRQNQKPLPGRKSTLKKTVNLADRPPGFSDSLLHLPGHPPKAWGKTAVQHPNEHTKDRQIRVHTAYALTFWILTARSPKRRDLAATLARFPRKTR